MVSEKLTSHVEPLMKEPIKGRRMTLWNRAEGTYDLEGNEGKRIMEGVVFNGEGMFCSGTTS